MIRVCIIYENHCPEYRPARSLTALAATLAAAVARALCTLSNSSLTAAGGAWRALALSALSTAICATLSACTMLSHARLTFASPPTVFAIDTRSGCSHAA